MKPIIAITVEPRHEPGDARTRGSMKLNWNYGEAIAEHGGVPILIPPMADMAEIANLIDGWLIPGGLDIDASRFGEANHPLCDLQDPARYEAEAALLARVDPNLPILGICYGCQFLNVARGGSLIQHLPDTIGDHRHEHGAHERHRIAPSRLREAIGQDEIAGTSYHHQGVGRIGDGLIVTSRADDGTVEALEATDRPWVVGVQWHPERSPEDEATRNLFRAFIAEASRYRETRRMAKVS